MTGLTSSFKNWVLLLSIFFTFSCSSPVATSFDSSEIRPDEEPYQETINDSEKIVIQKKGWTFTLTKKASYKIAGLVVSTKHYYSDRNSLLAPVDIALVFGDLYSNSLYKEIKWSQSGRWYWWKYDSSFPRQDNSYISRYSSNNHIIPSNDNLKKAAKSVSRGDIIALEGYLVYVDGKKGEATFWWNSSLSRGDTGDGSCEVLYLTKLRNGDNVYE